MLVRPRGRLRALAATLSFTVAAGCAGTIVRPVDLPPVPPPARGPRGAVLVLDQTDAAMAEEMRAYVATLPEVRESRATADADLRSVCPADGSGDGFVVLRPRMGRRYFACNASDRNLLFIYESAIVVGLPVTLISAVAWPWYGETTVNGTLDIQPCATGASASRTASSFRLRSEGRGFVRTDTIESAQAAATARGVTRKLLAAWQAGSTEGETR